jgi:hypothetical protein
MFRVNQSLQTLFTACVLCCFSAAAQSAPGDEHWDYQFGLPGANGAVLAIAAQGNGTYIGGTLITTVGNILATNIAEWNGTAWAAVGGGANNTVTAMASDGVNIYAGGFQRAGHKPAYGICRWNSQTTFLPPTTMQLGNLAPRSDGQFQLLINASGGASYVLEGTTNFLTWTPLLTNGVGACVFVDPQSLNLPLQFYRVRQIP